MKTRFTLFFFHIQILFSFGQAQNQTMKKLEIYPDEAPFAIEELIAFEEKIGVELPRYYREFLVSYNGGVSVHNTSEYLRFAIERFFSLEDLKIQNEYTVDFNDMESILEYSDEFEIDLKKLITIGICEQGTVLTSLNENEFGQIYFSHFSGGEGLEKTELKNFSELLNSLDGGYTEEHLNEYLIGKKIFGRTFFYIRDNPELGLKRFKNFYFYTKSKFKGQDILSMGRTLPQQYLNERVIFDFLISQGEPLSGLFSYAWNIEILKYLLEDLKLDINQPIENGEYPLVRFSSFYTSRWNLENYKKIMDFLLKGDYELNLSVKDKEGRTVSERIKLQNEEYEKQFKE